VHQSKFTVLKIMSRKIFGEFMKNFLKGLNPFKMQTNFKLDLLHEFLIQILLDSARGGIRTVKRWSYQSGEAVERVQLGRRSSSGVFGRRQG
jgi:hypothetical protein